LAPSCYFKFQVLADEIKVDSVSTHQVVPGVHQIRGNCSVRLKYEVEYALKRGTTDNAYMLQVGHENPGDSNFCMTMITENISSWRRSVNCLRLIMQAGNVSVLVDVPFEAFSEQFGEWVYRTRQMYEF
jgi:hypothetical protein